MKSKWNLTGRVFASACVVFWVGLQTPVFLLSTSSDPFRSFADTNASLNSSGVKGPTLDQARVSKGSAAGTYGSLPRSFEANCGQTDSQVRFLSRGSGYNLYLTAKEAVMEFRSPTNPSLDAQRHSANANQQSSAVRMKLVGANAGARIVAIDELPGKSSYFIGNDPKKWLTNVPNYSRVKYQNAYPGVDVVFYGNQRQLEYDFIVAPGADFKQVRLAFDGAGRIRLDDSRDLLIETSVGEIRQRKPIIYQETGGIKHPVEGGYAIRGEREVGFELGDYDASRAVVIDPVLVYSTSIGGSYNDNANAVAVDAEGNAYITGMTTSLDFPTVNPFQPNLKIGVSVGVPSDAFVTKLNPSGTALVYSTYLGGGSVDAANGIAVDAAGNAYVTGFSASNDFPTTPGAFQTKASANGDAFIAKLNAKGDGLVYSTRLGGPGSSLAGILPANVGRGIAVDAQGDAYVTGYTFSSSFPLKKPAQREFNRGSAFDCCGCLYFFAPAPPPLEDAFVTKLNSSGDTLVYSTYLGGIGQDEAFAIAIDSAGSAYVGGRSCSPGFRNIGPGGAIDAFLVKLSPTGKEIDYEIALGGAGNDEANGVAVDSTGNAYLTGQTASPEFPTTPGTFLRDLGGSVCYVTTNGGVSWQAAPGLPNSPVNVLAIDPTDPKKIYAGLDNGLFGSRDGGGTWLRFVLPSTFVTAIAIDPKTPSTIYANSFKSTDGGANWTFMRLPGFGLGCGLAQLLIDPSNTATVYLLSTGSVCGDVVIPGGLFKTTDGGNTWGTVRNGANSFGPNSLAIDPGNASTLYVTSGSMFTGGNLFKSTDGGNTWRVPYEGNRDFVILAIDPISTATLYLRDTAGNRNSLFKSTDGGSTFKTMGLTGVPIKSLVVDPANSSTLYAATGDLGNGGGVFKSTDGGQSWNVTDLIGMTINALAIDPLNSSRLYAGAYFDTDGFIAKINAQGSALVYSTYLGTRSPDNAAGIGVDEAGSAYVTGRTFSERFPIMDALQTGKASGPFDTVIFATRMNSAGSAIVYSTYLGGEEPGFSSGIAVDASGKALVVGTTGTFRPVPSASSIESVHGGFDAFVSKIASPPRIAGALVSGKNLIVTGEGFDRGAVILVDGAEQRTRNDESRPATILIGKKAAKGIAPGQKVAIQVRNADGMVSDAFSLAR
jgi:photosystem II stability/assembly factor-like uncharacterized protein